MTHPVLLPFLWVINGFLLVLYVLADHFFIVLLVPPLTYLTFHAPREQRPWSAGASALALLAAGVSPQPVPLLLLLMSLAGLTATRLEKMNPLSTRWNVTRGLALYALASLGYTAYQTFRPALGSGDPLLAAGQNYLSILISIAMYLLPVGYLGLLAQSLFAHPPSDSPERLIQSIRTRGRQ
jgi:hypothetical protein